MLSSCFSNHMLKGYKAFKTVWECAPINLYAVFSSFFFLLGWGGGGCGWDTMGSWCF